VMYQFLKSVETDKNYCYFFKNNGLFPKTIFSGRIKFSF
jgi:hypothetical protein